MTVEQALLQFAGFSRIARVLQCLSDVGLGYVKLGQPANSLSGGESQRIKLAKELSVEREGHTLYVLDEPTTGLHFADIDELLTVLHWMWSPTPIGSSILDPKAAKVEEILWPLARLRT